MTQTLIEKLEALPRYDLHEDAELNDDGTRNAYVGDCKNGDYIKHSDLRAIIEQHKQQPDIVAELVKALEDDAYAATFQSMAGYRTALTAKVKGMMG